MPATHTAVSDQIYTRHQCTLSVLQPTRGNGLPFSPWSLYLWYIWSRAMMNINHYHIWPLPTTRTMEPHFPEQPTQTQHYHDRLAWTKAYQQSRRRRILAGISEMQTGLSLRKASLKVSIAYHSGVTTTNASANLSSPKPRNILHEECENHTSHAGQMKARPYSKSAKRLGIPILVRSSRRPWKKEDASDGLKGTAVTAIEVAHQLLLNGSVKKDRRQANTYRNNSMKHCLTAQKHQICRKLSAPMKAGKAARPDGIFPDVLKNIGPSAVRWLQAFYDDVMKTAKIPKIWRSAIRKPGKPFDEPTRLPTDLIAIMLL